MLRNAIYRVHCIECVNILVPLRIFETIETKAMPSSHNTNDSIFIAIDVMQKFCVFSQMLRKDNP